MSQFIMYLTLILLCLSPGPESVVVVSGQGLIIKVLDSSDDQQCASAEERGRARNEIDQIANSTIFASICNGTPGWRRIAFINMHRRRNRGGRGGTRPPTFRDGGGHCPPKSKPVDIIK